ncbi:MAG: STAS domain-containing protein, partial [Planctomycetota bacterium]
MADIHINSTTTNLSDGTPVNIAEVKGAIDGTTVSEFEEEMLGFLDKGTPNLILEFAGVSYINSTGMGLLVKCADKFQEAGGDIKLVGVSPKISALFDMLGLLSLFKIFDNRDEALRAIKGGASSSNSGSGSSGGRGPAAPPPPKAPPPPPP